MTEEAFGHSSLTHGTRAKGEGPLKYSVEGLVASFGEKIVYSLSVSATLSLVFAAPTSPMLSPLGFIIDFLPFSGKHQLHYTWLYKYNS